MHFGVCWDCPGGPSRTRGRVSMPYRRAGAFTLAHTAFHQIRNQLALNKRQPLATGSDMLLIRFGIRDMPKMSKASQRRPRYQGYARLVLYCNECGARGAWAPGKANRPDFNFTIAVHCAYREGGCVSLSCVRASNVES